MNKNQIIKYIISIPKTILFNYRALPIKYAYKLPIFISYDAKIIHVKKGIIKLDKCENIRPLMIRLGFNGTEEITSNKTIINLSKGTLYFLGNCFIGEGCSLSLANNGILEIGKNFTANKNLFIACNEKIIIGNDVMFGWNCFLFDATGHVIYKDKIPKSSFSKIEIGNHIWVCSESHILKGAKISNNSVVAYRSLVLKKFENNNILIAGSPAKIIQENIDWENFENEENIEKNKKIQNDM